MRQVIKRDTSKYDPDFGHDDQPSSYEEAERLIGRRLDRRKVFAIIDGEVFESCSWSQACSGCCDDRENISCERGSGCFECAYTGRSRRFQWVPVPKN